MEESIGPYKERSWEWIAAEMEGSKGEEGVDGERDREFA